MLARLLAKYSSNQRKAYDERRIASSIRIRRLVSYLKSWRCILNKAQGDEKLSPGRNGPSGSGYFFVVLYNGNGLSERKLERIHRLVFQTYTRELVEGEEIDHINGIKTDNRVTNLRPVSHAENRIGFVSKRKNTTSRYRGVSFIKRLGKWAAMINKDKKNHFIGHFECEHQAAAEWNKKAIELGFFLKL